MQAIHIEPIGHVVSEIEGLREDAWGGVIAEIRLDDTRFEAGALEGLREFSHVEILFHLDQVTAAEVENKARRPRGNPQWPEVGIFAQRARKRPNRIGATICELLSVEGLSLRVRGLDALDGSPVVDIKPVMAEFLPDKAAVRQPQWSRELMRRYF